MWLIDVCSKTLHSKTVQDTYRHKGLRRQLIEDLRARGITDERVLGAMSAMPRHFFLEKAFEEWAYQDKAFQIGAAQTISQPFTVAYQTTLLDVQVSDKILEIGTGSGYQAAILALLAKKVYSIERQETLYRSAKKLLSVLDLANIKTYFSDGYVGLPEQAPFDKILVTAGASEVPEALKQQLCTDGGMLVIPVGEGGNQKMYRIRRYATEGFEQEILGDFRFVPFLSGLNKS